MNTPPKPSAIGNCLEWTGSRDKDGYGMVKIHGKMHRAHRISLEIKIGRKLKKNEWALHLCDNPPCYRQDHLVVGDALDNSTMARAKKQTLADKFLPGYTTIYTK